LRRRDFIKNTGIATAGVASGASLGFAGGRPPNILLILVDQMRTPRYSAEKVTPNVDRIAAQGVTFSNHFVSAAPCSPSRACLMTGTYTTQNSMNTNCDLLDGDIQPSLDPKIPTIGHTFKNAGYRTPYRGKWHLSRRKDLSGRDALREYGFEGWKHPDSMFGGMAYQGVVLDHFYAHQACRWLKNSDNHQKPWFLTCSIINPHDICEYPKYYPVSRFGEIHTDRPPDNWNDDLSGKPGAQIEFRERYHKFAGHMDRTDPDAWRRYMDYYAYCLKDMDESVGNILDALEQSGQRDNTIIVFTSDHGEMAGSHGLRTKGNFAYEEVMNVPLIVSWPGRTEAGVETDALASNVDVMPTLTAMAGLSNLPYMAGKDLSQVLLNPRNGSVRNEIVYHQGWEVDPSIRRKFGGFTHPAQVRSMRNREWKYAYYFKRDGGDETEFELYSLKDDPLEMTNLANDAGYLKKRIEIHDRLTEFERKIIAEFKA